MYIHRDVTAKVLSTAEDKTPEMHAVYNYFVTDHLTAQKNKLNVAVYKPTIVWHRHPFHRHFNSAGPSLYLELTFCRSASFCLYIAEQPFKATNFSPPPPSVHNTLHLTPAMIQEVVKMIWFFEQNSVSDLGCDLIRWPHSVLTVHAGYSLRQSFWSWPSLAAWTYRWNRTDAELGTAGFSNSWASLKQQSDTYAGS